MAALSDYLENQLLTHVFLGTDFSKPTNISIALTSGVPLDSDTGSTLPELASGVGGVSTNYTRYDLGVPSASTWDAVGTDDTTAYAVYQSTTVPATSGYFYPYYLNENTAKSKNTSNGTATTRTFSEFPSVNFYAPANLEQQGQTTNSAGYPLYDGNGFIKNKNQIVFPTAHKDWGWISGVAICDNSNHGSGNMLMYAELTNPRYVYTGDNIKFDVKSLEISLN